ncbi:2-oxoglutarate:acceptor oxidoreductase [Campylobacter sp. VicNov18]|uniref:effector protein CiaD n=1 Tax=Campylobacter bilis TaxID=2691918 RepID=UPI00130EACCC|nr:2-oxoglutarate:acceptor oxidoreductase [Campylobacter bilis]MPV63597.1 2-oxoglutarate:acceptor oxidoreductase [Campylobacter hepaticus]MBM0637097.1 2-oxoglutarate:acceptor oxidoreductase [Campylobacter bilis]MCC8277745.1 2-oxoglutarate:acceptor oxidoreductase [Campylobacter bilis]MCC8299354.1 2-oxoglutarate:acceptor oxidoreductase [Campylobacter bilis]MCC8300654.1 2-oxoglutarate:acceptor oxidoreductase [Campylobacter bilis]
MNLEDLAKKTINEVSSIMEEQRKQGQQDFNDSAQENLHSLHPKQLHEQQELEDKISLAKLEEEEIIQNKIENTSTENKKEFSQNENSNLVVEVQSLNEDIFLQRLRERILVLFEGLNSIKEEELESRLNLTLNFLEFLLANIEYKLKK